MRSSWPKILLVLLMTAVPGAYAFPQAFPLRSAIWNDPVINVCWENPGGPVLKRYRDMVQTSVKETWEKNSLLSFVGWSTCANETRGIRIRISDEGPHTKGLGKQIDGTPSGMVLNFTFNNWGQPCKTTKDFCIKTIAAHEFGHALAFSHEQNRSDRENWCKDQPQGPDGDIYIGPWDENSIMNYCNSKYNNNGALSEWDVVALRMYYGAPLDQELVVVRNEVTEHLGAIQDCMPADMRSVPACYIQCSQNVMSACESLGFMYAEGLGVIQSKEHAARLLAPACNSSRPRACEYLGQLRLEGTLSLDKNNEEARKFFEKACDGGGGFGCAELGRLAEQGVGAQVADVKIAAKFYRKSCDAEYAAGCASYGTYVRDGLGGEAQDVARAKAVFHKACILGSNRGCALERDLLAAQPSAEIRQ